MSNQILIPGLMARAGVAARAGSVVRLAARLATNLTALNDATVEQLVRVPSGKRIRIERKLVERAREYLGDEAVLRVFRGQTLVSPVFVPLIGPLLFSVKPRTVMVTERSVITLQQSRFSQSTIVGLVSKHECGSVPVEVSRWGLKIDGEEKIYASLSTLEDMKAVARLASTSAAEA
jgi:hypothetical protein